jgi:hypothetical protein
MLYNKGYKNIYSVFWYLRAPQVTPPLTFCFHTSRFTQEALGRSRGGGLVLRWFHSSPTQTDRETQTVSYSWLRLPLYNVSVWKREAGHVTPLYRGCSVQASGLIVTEGWRGGYRTDLSVPTESATHWIGGVLSEGFHCAPLTHN